jgi:hypothetical protein
MAYSNYNPAYTSSYNNIKPVFTPNFVLGLTSAEVASKTLNKDRLTIAIGVLCIIFLIFGIITLGLIDRIKNIQTTVTCLSTTQVNILKNIGFVGLGVFFIILILLISRMYIANKTNQPLYHPTNIFLLFSSIAFLATTIMISVAARKITNNSTTQCIDEDSLNTLKASSAISVILGFITFAVCFYSGAGALK